MKTLVTGATGFIGRKLIEQLDQPVVLSRNQQRARVKLAGQEVTVFEWDGINQSAPAAAFEGVEAVIHLAGESVGEHRWTNSRKQRIRDSRVLGTRNLVRTMAELKHKPKVFISASAVGYYGSHGDQFFDSSTEPGNDFLAEVCINWEKESQRATDLGIRVVNPRIGVVLGAGGGALKKMTLPFKLGLGSPLSSGRQYMPWIHIDDIVQILLFAMQNQQISGAVNAVSPEPVTNRQFTKALGKALNRPTLLPPVPTFMLRLMLGEFADVLLCSQRAVPKILQNAGYEFRYPQIGSALQAIFS